MRTLQLGAATGIAGVLIAGSLLTPAAGAPTVGNRATAFGADLAVAQMAPNAFTDALATITVRISNVGIADSGTPRILVITLPSSFGFASLLPLPAGVTCPTVPSVGFTGQIVCTLPPIAISSFLDIVYRAQPTTVGNFESVALLGASLDGLSDIAANDTSTVNVAVLGPTPRGQVDPGFPDFPDGDGFGGFGFGGFGHDDFDDCYSYCY